MKYIVEEWIIDRRRVFFCLGRDDGIGWWGGFLEMGSIY